LKLLGREYYQGTFTEPFLLFGPLAIHAAAGVTKRLINSNPIPPRPSLLTATAYPLLLIYLPIHLLTHRLIPSSPKPHISSFSPSELDYEFVKTGLARWPVRNWILYGGLALTGVIHAVEGWNVTGRTWFSGMALKKNIRKLLAGGIVGTVLLGLVFLSREPLVAFGSTLQRIDAIFLESFIYRM